VFTDVTYALHREAKVNSRTKRGWLVRGALTGALLVPLVLWLSGCWLFNVAPEAAFTISAQTGQAPFTVNFSAVLSSDEDGVIVKYEWDFGDGTSGSGESIAHTYDTAGTFSVVLRVTDDGGDSATTRKTIYVTPGEPPGPTASISASPTSGTSPLTVTFNASASTYASGTIASYEWDFGDGASWTGMNATHTYFSGGSATYTVTLTVRGSDGKTGTATQQISVTTTGGGTTPEPSGGPTARFVILNDDDILGGPAGTTGIAPYWVVFDPEDTEVDVGRALLQLIWSFGDGTSATTPNITEQEHTYVTEDPSEVFSITLLAMDNAAATDTITKTVKVYNHPPVAGFEIANPEGGHESDDPVDDGLPEEYTTRGEAVLADRWDDDDDGDGVIMGDLQALGDTDVCVFIRSLVVDEGTDDVDDYEADWFDLPVAQAGVPLTDDQGLLEMAEGVNAAPGTTKPVPDEYNDFENAFSYDPEGQSFEDRGVLNDITDDYPEWFPNQAWGIQYIYVDWDDGSGEEQFDYREETDSTGWVVGDLPLRPAYDQDFIVGHTYAFNGGSVTKTITIRVVDFLGAESTFSRDLILVEGTEQNDDLDE